MLQPVTLELGSQSATLLSENLGILNRYGFQVEALWSIRLPDPGCPGLMADVDPRSALQVLVEDFEEDEEPLKQMSWKPA